MCFSENLEFCENVDAGVHKAEHFTFSQVKFCPKILLLAKFMSYTEQKVRKYVYRNKSSVHKQCYFISRVVMDIST